MEIITALNKLHKFAVPCVVALGTFDGLHLGHLNVIRTAKREAALTGAKLAVFTFTNHPLALINPVMAPPALVTKEQKYKLLKDLGVDVLIDVPFNQEVADIEPAAFLKILRALNYSCLVVGDNFTYGRYGKGNSKTLANSAEQLKFKLFVLPLVTIENTIVSSTVIRKFIAFGQVDKAAKMLGRRYSLSGTVIKGQKRGRLLGYPTANLALENTLLAVPKEGVYAVWVNFENRVFGGMSNVGKNPTFGDVGKVRLETNIFDFSGLIYGKRLTVEFVNRIRGEIKFEMVDNLKRQLILDKEKCSIILKGKEFD